NIINVIVFGGLMVGGLLAANSFGLAGAKAVVGAGTAASKAAGKWGGRMALKYPALGAGTGIARLSDKAASRGNTGIFGGLNKIGLSKGVAGARKVGAPLGKAADVMIGKADWKGKNSLLSSTWAAAKKGSGLFGEYEKEKKKGEMDEEKKERDKEEKEGKTSIKEGQQIIDKLGLIEKALELERKAMEARKGGDFKLASGFTTQAQETRREYNAVLEEYPGKSREEIKKEAEEKIKAGEEMVASSKKRDERVRDIQNDLAQEKRKEDIEKEAHKKAEEHTKESGSGHKEESHPEPAKSGGEKSGHSGGH
ncbi:MAG: hypothetical protein Q8O49_00600, partial [bacterium]|nr:hypothetical protein [bacterium]